jgi:hypothetical protein
MDRVTWTRPPDGAGLWRDGPFVVASLDAELPTRCVKCNRRSGERRFTRLLKPSSDQSAAGIPIAIGLCERHLFRARTAEAWLGFGLFFIVCGLVMLFSAKSRVEIFFCALFVCVGAMIFLLRPWRLGKATVSLKKCDSQFMWLAGACPEFLDEIPPVPAGAASE